MIVRDGAVNIFSKELLLFSFFTLTLRIFYAQSFQIPVRRVALAETKLYSGSGIGFGAGHLSSGPAETTSNDADDDYYAAEMRRREAQRGGSSSSSSTPSSTPSSAATSPSTNSAAGGTPDFGSAAAWVSKNLSTPGSASSDMGSAGAGGTSDFGTTAAFSQPAAQGASTGFGSPASAPAPFASSQPMGSQPLSAPAMSPLGTPTSFLQGPGIGSSSFAGSITSSTYPSQQQPFESSSNTFSSSFNSMGTTMGSDGLSTQQPSSINFDMNSMNTNNFNNGQSPVSFSAPGYRSTDISNPNNLQTQQFDTTALPNHNGMSSFQIQNQSPQNAPPGAVQADLHFSSEEDNDWINSNLYDYRRSKERRNRLREEREERGYHDYDLINSALLDRADSISEKNAALEAENHRLRMQLERDRNEMYIGRDRNEIHTGRDRNERIRSGPVEASLNRSSRNHNNDYSLRDDNWGYNTINREYRDSNIPLRPTPQQRRKLYNSAISINRNTDIRNNDWDYDGQFRRDRERDQQFRSPQSRQLSNLNGHSRTRYAYHQIGEDRMRSHNLPGRSPLWANDQV